MRRISEVAGWTFASRILGLLRDVLLFTSLGTGVLNSAFILAFTLPNLFRRLLGEGALTSSSIPVLASVLERNGKEESLSLFNALMNRLGLCLLLLQLFFLPLFLFIHLLPGVEERWHLAARLSMILFPYMWFICLGALVCGMLNVLGRFGLAAFNQVWLNLLMIGTLLGGMWHFPDEGWARVLLLSAGVVGGGVLQLVVPSGGLYRSGWRPRLHSAGHPELNRILKLFLPGLLGAAIFQLNILVSRFLAFSLDDRATGLLYIASRMVELPLGVFAIAITTVIFPDLSRLASTGSGAAFRETYSRGLGLIFLITLPACLGLILLAQPILSFLFEWGLFEARDVAAARPVLMASALGLPFFAWSSLVTRAWYARQELTIPVRMAGVNLVLNLILGLLLMGPYGAVGLAVANTCSAAVHCLVLQALLPGKTVQVVRPGNLLLVSAALVLMGVFAFSGSIWMQGIAVDAKLRNLLVVGAVIPASAGVYLGVLALGRHPVIEMLRRRGTGASS